MGKKRVELGILGSFSKRKPLFFFLKDKRKPLLKKIFNSRLIAAIKVVLVQKKTSPQVSQLVTQLKKQ